MVLFLLSPLFTLHSFHSSLYSPLHSLSLTHSLLTHSLTHSYHSDRSNRRASKARFHQCCKAPFFYFSPLLLFPLFTLHPPSFHSLTTLIHSLPFTIMQRQIQHEGSKARVHQRRKSFYIGIHLDF